MDHSGSAPRREGPALPVDGGGQPAAGVAPEGAGAGSVPADADPGPGTPTGAGVADGPPAPLPPTGSAHLVGALVVYSLLRLALVAALTGVLMFFMPLIVALLFAIIVQLPLSWLLFAGPRRRVNEAMAQSSAQRRSERAKLQAALSGDEPLPPSR